VCSASRICVPADAVQETGTGDAPQAGPEDGGDPGTSSDPGGDWDPGAPDIAGVPDLAGAHDAAGASDVAGWPEPVQDAEGDEGAPDFGPELPPNCEPGLLPIPEKWAGTFEGYITSNIPDFGGYTFNGGVDGNASFSINCVQQRLVVSGKLEGGQTNCALASGCPFTATVEGEYDPDTQVLTADLKDGRIDFDAVVVLAEGTMEGHLEAGPAMTGTWKGHKTDIINNLYPGLDLSWVVATGEGSWEASPVP